MADRHLGPTISTVVTSPPAHGAGRSVLGGGVADDSLGDFLARVSPHFHRREPWVTAGHYVQQLMRAGDTPTPGIHAGVSRESVQRMLRSARWDCGAVRDELVRSLDLRRRPSPTVLVLTCRDFPKKGACSVGVERRFRPGSGRVQNVQTGVLAVLDQVDGPRLVDRELFLPRHWTEDLERRRHVGVPGDVRYRSVGQLAAEILRRQLADMVPIDWIVCDGEIGEDRVLCELLRHSGIAHAVELSGADVRAGTPHGPSSRVRGRPSVCAPPGGALAVEQVLPSGSPQLPHALLARCAPAALPDRARALGALDRARTFLDDAGADVGLGSYESRHWISWYRHITLVSVALHYRGAGVGV